MTMAAKDFSRHSNVSPAKVLKKFSIFQDIVGQCVRTFEATQEMYTNTIKTTSKALNESKSAGNEVT